MVVLGGVVLVASGPVEAASPPTTSVVLPANGATISGNAALDAVASSAVGISSVQFEITGGSLMNDVIAAGTPTLYGYLAEWNSTTVPNGTYALSSVATDSANNVTTSSPFTIIVSNTPPSTSVVLPSSSGTVSGETVVDAVASSSIGISQVQYEVTGGTLTNFVVATGTPTFYGYLAYWNTGPIPNGTYALTSVATDSANEVTTSAPLTVAVSNAPPLGVESWRSLNLASNVSELPLPPTAPSAATGSCTTTVNANDTGCITDVGSPGFYWDPHYVFAGVDFAGAPAAPDPGSIYTGNQMLLIKTDGTTFPDGDPWKCITCGIPSSNIGAGYTPLSYPPAHALPGDTKALVGNGILDCGGLQLDDPNCAPADEHIYPIELDGQPLGNTIGGLQTREWRLDPDGVHLGWNGLIENAGVYNELVFFGRLTWDATTSAYDLTNVTMLFNSSSQYLPYTIGSGNQLTWNPRGFIGEFRGFSADGQSALGIYPLESDNMDAVSTSLATGQSRALTYHAEYTDPMFASPDGKWMVNEEVLGSGRDDFIGGMEGLPPLTDQITVAFVSMIRNNDQRRFFNPFITSTAVPTMTERANSGSDPNWNARADPVWLADSTAIVYQEALVTAPDCGGVNPLPCPVSTEPGGRATRLMIARFPGLTPTTPTPPAPVSDSVPWGTPYTVGDTIPSRPLLPAGTYTLNGLFGGSATVVLTNDASNSLVMKVQVTYHNYNSDLFDTINGTESVTRLSDAFFGQETWNENLASTGPLGSQSKITSPGGFTLGYRVLLNYFEPTGWMTTTVNGNTYLQPANDS
jgi:hypothetical protein